MLLAVPDQPLLHGQSWLRPRNPTPTQQVFMMFRYLSQPSGSQSDSQIHLTINDREISVPAGTSVWAAMAQAGDTVTRLSPVTEQERSAYCAMGVCFECLVEIDGMPNRQACLTQVCEGMSVKRQEITQSSDALADVSGNNAVQYQEGQ